MKNLWTLPLLFLGLGCPALAGAQAGTTLLVKTDMSCDWKLDGEPMTPLRDGEATVLLVQPGEHLIEAASADGTVTMRTKVQVAKAEATARIQLQNLYDRKQKLEHPATPAEQAEAALPPTWTDPATGLMWARRDNGYDLDWNQAVDYCTNLQLGGERDWRLPTLEELQAIYDSSAGVSTRFDNGVTYKVRVKGKLRLSGWTWSSSLDETSGRPLNIVLDGHQPGSGFPRIFSFSMRALCVRRHAA